VDEVEPVAPSEEVEAAKEPGTEEPRIVTAGIYVTVAAGSGTLIFLGVTGWLARRRLRELDTIVELQRNELITLRKIVNRYPQSLLEGLDDEVADRVAPPEPAVEPEAIVIVPPRPPAPPVSRRPRAPRPGAPAPSANGDGAPAAAEDVTP
jgi:hypothetical protein